MPSDEPILLAEDLAVRYGEHTVLERISFILRRGQLVSIIGPNGGGKSTLLKAVAGLVPLASGRIENRARRVGYVPQQMPLDREMPLTVAEFLSLKVCRRGWWGRGHSVAVRADLARHLENIGAAHLLDRALGRLSGGEFQRVLIAYALLGDPELLLLDEPLTGVDIRGGLSFDGLLHHLHDHLRLAVLMVSHDLHMVGHLSDEVLCLNGEICCRGTPEVVLRPENLARAYGRPGGLVTARGGDAFIPLSSIRK